jgi:hypothetical protein
VKRDFRLGWWWWVVLKGEEGMKGWEDGICVFVVDVGVDVVSC